MKLTVCLSASLIALLALPAGSRAATPDDPVNPYANLDPDGVPLAVIESQDNKPNPAQAETLREQADEQARESNWLLLEFEQQFKRNSADSTAEDRTVNMYLQLSMNKDLDAVTGAADSDSQARTPAPSLHAEANASSQNSMGLRPDDSLPARSSFTPLMSALSSPAASSAIQPFYSGAYAAVLPPSLAPITTLDTPTAPSGPAPAPSRPPSPLSSLPTDTIDMETPGMIADKSNPLPGTPDLNLDSLPDQDNANAQDKQPADQQPQLPELQQAMDAEALHAVIQDKLAPPKVAQANTQSQQPQQPKPATPPPPETPSPISQQPQLSPVHAPLPNPFDILNH